MPIIGQISVGDGATFTPSVDANGVLSWTNNKNLTNPANYDIGAAVQTEVTAQVPGEVSSQIATKVPASTGDADTPVYVNASGVVTSTGKTFSSYLPLAGGTMTGAISFDTTGEIGYRATTHTEPANPCKQLIMSATDIDHWSNQGGAKIALHTYDDTLTNVEEDGGFSVMATDGTNSKSLQGKPDGSLKWAGESVLTPLNGARQMSVFCSAQKGAFTVSAPNNTTYFACIVAFGSPTNRDFNRVFVANGYWAGDFRNRYYRIPFTGDNNDGEYTVTISTSSNSFTFTTSNVGNIKCTVTVLVEDINAKTTLTFTPA